MSDKHSCNLKSKRSPNLLKYPIIRFNDIKPMSLRLNLEAALKKSKDYSHDENYLGKNMLRHKGYMGKSRVKDPNSIINKVVRFNTDNQIKSEFINQLKQENQNFNKIYKERKIYKEGSDLKRNIFNPNEIFKDLISKYKEKDYNAPKLSIKTNIFQSSPLILRDNQILNQCNKIEIPNRNTNDILLTYENDENYMERLNEIVNDKLKNRSDSNLNKDNLDLMENILNKKTLEELKIEEQNLINQIRIIKENENFKFKYNKPSLNKDENYNLNFEGNDKHNSVTQLQSPKKVIDRYKSDGNNCDYTPEVIDTIGSTECTTIESKMDKCRKNPKIPIRLFSDKQFLSLKVFPNCEQRSMHRNSTQILPSIGIKSKSIKSTQNRGIVNSIKSLPIKKNPLPPKDLKVLINNEAERVTKLNQLYNRISKGKDDNLISDIILYFQCFERKEDKILTETE